jgi:hypothetical protein
MILIQKGQILSLTFAYPKRKILPFSSKFVRAPIHFKGLQRTLTRIFTFVKRRPIFTEIVMAPSEGFAPSSRERAKARKMHKSLRLQQSKQAEIFSNFI